MPATTPCPKPRTRTRLPRIQSLLCSLTLAIAAAPAATQTAARSAAPADPELVPTRTSVPTLEPSRPFEPKDNTIIVELSEYAGYSGLIVANGGLAPSKDSHFFKKHGLLVQLVLSEEESWSALNAGKIAAAATTVDVLAVYARQLRVAVSALIGYSRGADSILVRNDIRTLNSLAGKTLATCQFTEADFFLRYLAAEAGLSVNPLPSLAAAPAPGKINVVYTDTAFSAGDLFLRDIRENRNRLAGCVTWEPKTGEVLQAADARARTLISNRNILIIADILLVNKPFADKHPDMVYALAEGLIWGNQQIRENPRTHLKLIEQAFQWEAGEAEQQLAKVHLANLPENEAFFSGQIDAAGSFTNIYEMAALSYGKDLIGVPPNPAQFLQPAILKRLRENNAQLASARVDIKPVSPDGKTRAEASPDGENALLTKDIRFQFEPNSPNLDPKDAENLQRLQSIARLLQVSPGSLVVLRGHADGSQIEMIRARNGEAAANRALITLKRLSEQRCETVKAALIQQHRVDPDRIVAEGVGADEPTGQGADADRRVAVQWFTIE